MTIKVIYKVTVTLLWMLETYFFTHHNRVCTLYDVWFAFAIASILHYCGIRIPQRFGSVRAWLFSYFIALAQSIRTLCAAWLQWYMARLGRDGKVQPFFIRFALKHARKLTNKKQPFPVPTLRTALRCSPFALCIYICVSTLLLFVYCCFVFNEKSQMHVESR